jgi:hypothetical protein
MWLGFLYSDPYRRSPGADDRPKVPKPVFFDAPAVLMTMEHPNNRVILDETARLAVDGDI